MTAEAILWLSTFSYSYSNTSCYRCHWPAGRNVNLQFDSIRRLGFFFNNMYRRSFNPIYAQTVLAHEFRNYAITLASVHFSKLAIKIIVDYWCPLGLLIKLQKVLFTDLTNGRAIIYAASYCGAERRRVIVKWQSTINVRCSRCGPAKKVSKYASVPVHKYQYVIENRCVDWDLSIYLVWSSLIFFDWPMPHSDQAHFI